MCEYGYRIGAFVGGAVAFVVLSNGGPLVEVHERAHALAARILMTCKVKVEVYSWGAWRQIAATPGLVNKFKLAGRLLTYWGQKGATTFSSGKTRFFSVDMTRLLFSAAGPAADLAIFTTAVGVGVGLRNRRPRVAAMLIGFGICGYLVKGRYPYDAADVPASVLKQPHAWSHDFCSMAYHGGKLSGRNPEVVAKGLLYAWGASVPLTALTVWLVTD